MNLRIECPWCGERDHTEFSYGGDATIARPKADTPMQGWVEYVYIRDNPKGPHQEHWHHVHGCRQWLRVTRDTLTHEISQVGPSHFCSGEP